MKLRMSVALVATALAATFVAASPVGELGPSAHILGGRRLQLNRVPVNTFWLRLREDPPGNNTKSCIGVRLNNDWLMTLAECLYQPNLLNVEITPFMKYGYETDHYRMPNGGGSKKILKFRIHPAYDNATKSNNIALIKDDFYYHPNETNNARLPFLETDKNATFVNQTGYVLGFEEFANRLGYWTIFNNKLSVSIVDLSECKDFYPSGAPKDAYICGKTRNRKGLVEDDLGAPLILETKNPPLKRVLGMASSFRGQLTDGPQTILFFKVHPYVEWISKWTGVPVRNTPKDN